MDTQDIGSPSEQGRPSHFTYETASGDLRQGDLLERTEDIEKVLQRFHPYYLKEDYIHFMVLTQTCDLVRREHEECKAQYITLAAVRPLAIILERELCRNQSEFARQAGACGMNKRTKIEQVLKRLLDNNNPEYFYLHQEQQFGVEDNEVAFLRLSVALRIKDNYEMCLRSRILSLNPEFRAKLGWLVGDIYSRVGTVDWVDKVPGADVGKMINDLLDHLCEWVDPGQLQRAEKQKRDDFAHKTDAEIRTLFRQEIRATEVPSKAQIILEQVTKAIRKQRIPNVDVDALSKTIRATLETDTTFQNYAGK